MSSIGRWSYTNQLTFWETLDPDAYGVVEYQKAYTLLCSYKLDKSFRSEGLIPSSDMQAGQNTFYFELDPERREPLPGWIVALGEFDQHDPPEESYRIVSVMKYDTGMFGETIPDYEVKAI